MKNKLAIIVVLVMILSLVACETETVSDNVSEPIIESETVSDNVSEPIIESETEASINDPRVSVYTDLIMNNIEDWEHVSDDYTKQHTYDVLDVSSFYLLSTGKRNEFYFLTGYTLNKQDGVSMGSDFSYGRVYYLTENSFEYMYNSGDHEYYSLLEKRAMFGTTEFSQDTVEKREYVVSFLEESLNCADEYFAEIYDYENETITLSKEEEKLFNNLYSAVCELEQYTEESSANPLVLPLAKLKYHIIGGGECEVLMYYGASLNGSMVGNFISRGYYIDGNGYSDLSEEEKDRLENTTFIRILDWNTDWSSDKKVYMLKKSICG